MGNGGSKTIFPLVTLDQSVLTGASPACLAALNANVSCGSAVATLYSNVFQDFSPEILSGLCNGDCSKSLDSYRENIRVTCAADATWEDTSDSSIWPITYLADRAIYGMNLTCLRRSDGTMCNTWFQQDGKTAQSVCDECYLETLRQQALSPVADTQREARAAFSSLSTNCSYTGTPVTQTITNVLIASPTRTPDCVSTYLARILDTPASVSFSQNVSTFELLNANGLRNDTKKLGTVGSLCIRNQCRVYPVNETDTCQSIARSQGISEIQLLTWNPSINGLCSDLSSRASQYLCTSNPLGNFTVLNTDLGTVQVPAPANVASRTNTNCAQYHNMTAADDCGTISLRYNILIKDLQFLNPSINNDCSGLNTTNAYCVRAVGRIQDYPGYDRPTFNWTMTPEVGKIMPWYDMFTERANATSVEIANGTRTDCWKYMWWNSTAGRPNTCEYIASDWQIDMDRFLTWNPSLNETSCAIAASSSYCVALASPTPTPSAAVMPPSPRGVGEVSGCVEWQEAVLDCRSHLRAAQLTLDQFYQWNPSVGADCSGMVAGTFYCIGRASDAGPVTPSTTTTAASGATPTPTQSGMASDCNKFYKVRPGDGCYEIAKNNSITTDDFYAWNPAVGSNCETLYPNYYVCVGRNLTSIDGKCGRTNGKTCKNSQFGGCCSMDGSCGFSNEHCNQGCQRAYGFCSGVKTVSPDGTCGGVNGYTCEDSKFGGCCSPSGQCGFSNEHCNSGCQKSYGFCNNVQTVSPDGTCGGSNGYTCKDSKFGGCCSSSNYCGFSNEHCGSGCQSTFGVCSNAKTISPDGTCGGNNGYTCAGSQFGDCCSSSNYCGKTSDYCSSGCQSNFGKCA